MFETSIDHVQIATPKGCEPDAHDFFGYLLKYRAPHLFRTANRWGACFGKVLHSFDLLDWFADKSMGDARSRVSVKPDDIAVIIDAVHNRGADSGWVIDRGVLPMPPGDPVFVSPFSVKSAKTPLWLFHPKP